MCHGFLSYSGLSFLSPTLRVLLIHRCYHRQMSCLEYGTNLFRLISLVLISSFYLVSQSINGIMALSYFSVSQTGRDRTKWWMNYCQIKRTNGKKIHSTYYTDKSETSSLICMPTCTYPFSLYLSMYLSHL